MKKAVATLYQRLEKKRIKQNGKYGVSLRIYFNRKYEYYYTGIDLTEKDFEDVLNQNKDLRGQKRIIRTELNEKLTRANDIIKKLKIFTFDAFENLYLKNKKIIDSVIDAFDDEIQELKKANRLGTAVSYENAKNSIEAFKQNLTFSEVTVSFLNEYKKWMTNDKGNSKTTVGIYLRALRVIYNKQGIDESLYPFGKGKFVIPKGSNKKKALTVQEIAKIYQYEAPAGSPLERSRDYWIFLYLCNGMNIKDFCFLKWKNFKGDKITFVREKTKNTNDDEKPIEIYLKKQAIEILNKWAVRTLSKEDFIFPHLSNEMTTEQKRATYKQVGKNVNKYMKRIAKELGINRNVTTIYARHSFATVLKRSGAQVEMISELLGHSSVDVTKNYLDGFEEDQIIKKTDALIVGFD